MQLSHESILFKFLLHPLKFDAVNSDVSSGNKELFLIANHWFDDWDWVQEEVLVSILIYLQFR